MDEIDQHVTGFKRQMSQQEGLSGTTAASYCAKVKDFFKWLEATNNLFPAGSFVHATRRNVEAYLEHCFKIGNRNQTRLTKLTAIHKFYKYLIYEDIVTEDITVRIPRPKARKGLVQKFTQAEILKLFAVMDINTEKGLRDAVIFILGAFCGLRISEIKNLNMSDIVDDGGAIDINIVKTKHESSRTVYLWKSPSRYVNQWMAIRISQGAGKDSSLLVSYKRGDNASTLRPTSPGIDRILKRYATIAGIRKPVVTMHMLRATHASDLRYIKGYDVFAISQRLGHEDISTTQRYVPARGRINREYPSLAVYWKEFNHLWRGED